MIELLIFKGANINIELIIYQNIIKSFLIIINENKERNLNLNNKTPLHIAIENKLDKIGALLISKGADINAEGIIYRITKNHF